MNSVLWPYAVAINTFLALILGFVMGYWTGRNRR
jgi:hypothetical protein